MISLTDIVNRHLIGRSKNDHRDYSYFHASEWDGCHRKIAYEYYEEKKILQSIQQSSHDPKLLRIFDNGHSMHDRYKKYFESTATLYGR